MKTVAEMQLLLRCVPWWEGVMCQNSLSCKWQKKEASLFQLCQWTVDGHGQSILPQIFTSLAYFPPSISPGFCQAALFLQENFDSPFLCGAGPFLSTLHLWQFLQNTPGIAELSDEDRGLLPPGAASFPSADAFVSTSAGFSMCSMMMSGWNLGLQLMHIQI